MKHTSEGCGLVKTEWIKDPEEGQGGVSFHEDEAALTLEVGDPSPVTCCCAGSELSPAVRGQEQVVTVMGAAKCPWQSPVHVLGLSTWWLALSALSLGSLPGLPWIDF